MRGSSRSGAAKVDTALDAALRGGANRSALADDLFAASGFIESNISLRRALADPSRDAETKRELATKLFSDQVSREAASLIAEIAAQRWSSEGDLGDTLESAAVRSLLAAAEESGRIDAVEDELFRFERIVAGDAGLRDTLSVRNADSDGKAALVAKLLAGKANPETTRLAEQAVMVPRGRRLDRILAAYLELAATRRDELTALVTSAIALDEQQQARLITALEEIYKKRVGLQIVVDSAVVGGIRVQIGDEVVDGTVMRRLDEVRRGLTS